MKTLLSALLLGLFAVGTLHAASTQEISGSDSIYASDILDHWSFDSSKGSGYEDNVMGYTHKNEVAFASDVLDHWSFDSSKGSGYEDNVTGHTHNNDAEYGSDVLEPLCLAPAERSDSERRGGYAKTKC